MLNKKSQIMQGIVSNLGIIFIFVIVALIVLTIISNFRTKIDGLTDATTEPKTAIDKMDNTLYRWFDYAVLILSIGLLVLLCMNAYNSFMSPILTIILILLLMVLPFVGIIITQIYSSFIGASTDFSTLVAKMPFTNVIMSNLGLVVVAYIIIIGIFYILKPTQGEIIQ